MAVEREIEAEKEKAVEAEDFDNAKTRIALEKKSKTTEDMK